MTPKKDEYMRGYCAGFKDGMAEMLPALTELVSETISLGQHLVYNAPTMSITRALDAAAAAISKAKGAA